MVIPFPTEDVSIDHFHVRGLRARYQNSDRRRLEDSIRKLPAATNGCWSRSIDRPSSYFAFSTGCGKTRRLTGSPRQCATSLTHCSSVE